MKKVVKFSNLFLPCAILSTVIILSGIIGFFVRGINYGIDFQAGFIEKICIAPTALTLTYDGNQTLTIDQTKTGMDLVVTGVSDDNQTYKFPYSQYATIGDFIAALSAVPGVTAQAIAPVETSLKQLFPDSEVLNRLTKVPYRFHYVPAGIEVISADTIRKLLVDYPDASVQVTGKPEERMFQIRLADNGTDPNASMNLRASLATVFNKAYGDDNVAVISTDFVGSRLSSSMASTSAILVVITLLLISLYCMFRFRWDFAIGGVLAIAHDALIIVTFVIWTRMQFNSITIAAILTILGYSINDTVVIFDRIRENMKYHPEMKVTDILNLAQTEMLGRTIITTIATMLAVTSLYLFTSGDMKDFALALLVGMTSGVYSTIYIASAFINFVSKFRKDGGKYVEKKKVSIEVASGELV